MNTEIQTREFRLFDILNTSWRVFTRNIKSIIMVTILIYIPLNTIIYFFEQNLASEGMEKLRDVFQLEMFLEVFIGIVVILAINHITYQSILGYKLTYGKALQWGSAMMGGAIWASLLGNLIGLGLTFLLIVPGFVYFTYYIYTPNVVALKGLRGKQALNYSKSIVKGHFFKVLGISFLFTLIQLIFSGTIGMIEGLCNLQYISIFIDTILDCITSFFVVGGAILFINLDYQKNPLVLAEIENVQQSEELSK